MTTLVARGLLVGLVVLAVVQHSWYWPQLPARVATHFDFNGQPNDWMDRTTATLVLLGLQIGVPLFLFGVGSLQRWMPPSLINVPRREYWLHPERRDQTLDYIASVLAWIGVISGLFIAVIAHLTFLANRDQQPLNSLIFGIALTCYMVGVITLSMRITWKFR